MDSEHFEILAGNIEAEEVLGSNGKPLVSEDILPILEFLWDQGVNLMVAVEVEETIFLEEN